MGIFARLSDIFTANLNTLLDKAENPERMLVQVIREMEEGLDEAREHGATAIAVERRLRRELEVNQAAAAQAKEQARLAWACAHEDLARQALVRKIEADDLAEALQPQLEAAEQAGREVRSALQALEARLGEARRRQRLLAARQRAAQVQLLVEKALSSPGRRRSDPLARFGRFEEKLLETEDQLRARAAISRLATADDDELHRLARTKRIEDELRLLKSETEIATGCD